MGGEREETVGTRKPKRDGGGKGGGETVQGAPSRKGAPAAPDASMANPDGGPAPDGGAGLSQAQLLIRALEAAHAAGTSPPPGLGGQKIRMHESKGQIHFHADDDGLKAGVPVADIWGGWQRLLHLDTFKYIDTEFNTILVICTRLEAGDVVEAYINLAPCRATNGPTMQALERVIGR
jgi:hypothetical protein